MTGMTTRTGRRSAATGVAVMVTVVGVLAAGAATASTTLGLPMFVGASPGVGVAFELVPLPPLADPNGPLGDEPGRPYPKCDIFTPSVGAMLSGNTVIETEEQMRQVWAMLFDAPYDAGLFDFDETFVALMGSGLLFSGETFTISRVESFDGIFTGPDPKFPETYLEPGLAVISETMVPGVPPPPDHEPEYIVSAARIDRSHLNNLFFHGSFLFAP